MCIHSGLIGAPVLLDLNSSCFRKSSPAAWAASHARASFVSPWNSTRPQMGARLSWNEECVASGFRSQFHPPSGHCDRSSTATRCRTRRSRCLPSREQTARALPSMEAWRLSRPAITSGSSGVAIQSRTWSAARFASRLVRGTPSSIRETRRQCAPFHLEYGWTPNPPSACCPANSAAILDRRHSCSSAGSFPFDGAGRLGSDVEHHAVHALHLVDDAVAHAREHLVRHARPI